MLHGKMLILILSGTLITSALADPPPQGGPVGSSDAQAAHVVVGPRAVGMPKGVFLLVRKGKEFGAIKFTSIEPGEEKLMGKASYESFFQNDGSGSFLNAHAIKQSGELSTKPLTGIGRFSFGGGKRKLQVGNWAFPYHFPAWVSMWPYGKDERDHGYEFAPTSAREIAEVDVFDKRLQWFRYDSNTSTTLLVSDLAK
jgi:hypothetical protein